MKKTALLLLISLAVTTVYGQKDLEKKKEKMEAQKVAFISKHIDLSKEEAQNFWPIYNEHQEEHKILREQEHKLTTSLHKRFDQMSNQEVKKKLEKLHEIEEKKLKLKKEHFAELLEVLTAKKIAQLFKAEMLFKKELLGRIKHHDKRGSPPHKR